MTLRTRFLLTLAPLLLLTAALGAADAVLLFHVSRNIDDILRDNLRSVDYMVDLDAALDRIDESFRLALAGRPSAGDQYDEAWKEYSKQQNLEEHNVTILPRERELVDELAAETGVYRTSGDAFLKTPSSSRYDGPEGLAAQRLKIRRTAEDIRLLNEKEMERASAAARWAAVQWCLGLAAGLIAAALLAGFLGYTTLRAVLGPLRELVQSAEAIAKGNFNLIVSTPDGEIGQVARAFNHMTAQLRDYRQSHSAELLRAQRTGQAVLDSFPDPILVVDSEGRVEMANPAARRVLGVIGRPPWNQGRTDGGPPAEVWQPPAAIHGSLENALKRQEPFFTQAFDQTLSFRLDGEEHSYLPQVLPISDPYGLTLGAAVVLNDVTRFRLLDQIKSDLAATVSHELKTPLTGVRLALHLILEETVGPLNAKQTELLVDARDNAERLLRTIEHLLALARLEHGREPLQVRREEAQALLQTAADGLRVRAEAKRVEVVVGDASALPAVGVDAQRFGLALSNLLDNALDYTDEGGTISLIAQDAGETRVRFSVADTGMGIPPEYLPRVFEKFFRVPGRSIGRGTGLGLAIVREIVSAHHGEIVCESQPGKGTVFHLTVPAWQEGGAAP
jgi:signal transduction histidine kinase